MTAADLPTLSVAELEARFLTREEPLSAEAEAALRADPRAGARAVAAAVERRRARNRAEGQRLRGLLRFEAALWEQGVTRIAGVDEAGMGTLAGPVVAAAAILPPGFRPRGLDDSKVLDEAERERLAGEIKAGAVAWALGSASHQEVDAIDVYEVQLREAASRNHGRWGELSAHLDIWTAEQQYPVVITSYGDVVAYLRDWAATRYAWMDEQMNGAGLTTF